MFFMISCKTQEPVKDIQKKPVSSVYKGKARITSIIPSKERNGRESDSYMDIYYIFIPSEQGIIKKYNYPEFKDSGLLLNYDNKNSFHKNSFSFKYTVLIFFFKTLREMINIGYCLAA